MKPLTFDIFRFVSRFKVHYFERNVNNDEKTKVGEGEVLYIAPRHPEKGVKTFRVRDLGGSVACHRRGP